MDYYKRLYEQTKLMLEKYQDEIVPELCEQLEQVEQERDAAISNLYSVCEDSGDACGLCKHLPSLGSIDHLRELVQAEKDGRLVVLPCFPDETYWQMHGDVPAVSRFDGICIIDSDMNLFYQINGDNVNAKDIGKTVFLTREEAEAAVKGAGS